MHQEIILTLKGFQPISLKEMDSVALMNRTDTKFLVHRNKLIEILEELKTHYQILKVADDLVMTYSSMYYDTKNHKFYHDHHNGKLNRTKIRIRKYLESRVSYLEVKQKNAKGRTNKERILVGDFEESLSIISKNFIQQKTSLGLEISPSLQNQFNRITLVSKSWQERATIDFNLSFKNKESKNAFDNLAIIEVKQKRINRNSPIFQVLKSQHIYPERVSKYCLGMISLNKDLKYNSFKPKLLKINRLISRTWNS